MDADTTRSTAILHAGEVWVIGNEVVVDPAVPITEIDVSCVRSSAGERPSGSPAAAQPHLVSTRRAIAPVGRSGIV